MAEVGREIKRRREERGWNQAKLAVEAGMAVSGVSQIENGRRNPNSITLEKLAKALEVEVGDFFPRSQTALPFETRLERFVRAARYEDDEELERRAAELAVRIDELADDPVGLPRKLRESGPPGEVARHLRKLAETADELHAVAQVLVERTQKEASSVA